MTLKPCPFCGGDVENKQSGRDRLTIECRHCHIKYTQRTKYQSLEWLEEKMAETWNTRWQPIDEI